MHSRFPSAYLDLAIRKGLTLSSRDRALADAAWRRGVTTLPGNFDRPSQWGTISASWYNPACTKLRSRAMKKKIPASGTDKEAQDFVGTADLTEYDLSGGTPVQFEFELN